MKKKLLVKVESQINESDLKLSSINASSTFSDIAIIGLDCKFGGANNESEFWESLISQEDLIRPFPEKRKEAVEEYLFSSGVGDLKNEDFLLGAYLENIDEFDYAVFGLSPKESSLLDPNQRILLQSAWKALENAGYGGNTLRGSNTGVYLGFSSDFGEQYTNFIKMLDREAVNLSISGCVKSIIASRISYHFDFKGPAMLFDTACSSSLVAIHNACMALKNLECNMALAGGVKIHLVPTRAENTEGLGIFKTAGVESHDGRTKTFNVDSDGTGIGEGVSILVLKRLEDAIKDNDNIRAIIKGSAVNQDGSSIGITAPNADAQEKLILKTWKSSDVKPEDISYIEAHGTATKLGDPIEVNALSKAFRKSTDKKNFCAIGSVKTNIGHLDSAAGIAGLAKVLLSFEKEQIPPILHFKAPNKEIDFANSPFFVADKIIPWKKDLNKNRLAGISSFGLSGTNCHLLLQDYLKTNKSEIELDSYHLPISANSPFVLKKIIKNYHDFLQKVAPSSLYDLVATASTGRSHMKHRLLIQFKSLDELKEKIQFLVKSEVCQNYPEKYISYGTHTILYSEKANKSSNEYTEAELRSMSNEINSKLDKITLLSGLDTLAQGYINGAEIDWDILYPNHTFYKTPIPTYPFDKTKCWINPNKNTKENFHLLKKEMAHPLLDQCIISSDEITIFSTAFSANRHWELKDHKIQNDYLLPGTAYIEMVYQAMQYIAGTGKIPQIENILFLSPLKLKYHQERTVHTVIFKDQDQFKVSISSKETGVAGDFVKHMECKVNFEDDDAQRASSLDVESYKKSLKHHKTIVSEDFKLRDIETGDRWHCTSELHYSKSEFLAILKLPESYKSESTKYFCYPSLLDCAVNATNFIVGDTLYLPFSYRKIAMFQELPNSVYSKFNLIHDTDEIKTFDIQLYSTEDKLVGEISQYSIKKVTTHESTLNASKLFHEFVWKEYNLKADNLEEKSKNFLLIAKDLDYLKTFNKVLENEFTVEKILLTDSTQSHPGIHLVSLSNPQWDDVLGRLKGHTFHSIWDISGLSNTSILNSDQKDNCLNATFLLAKSLLNNRIKVEVSTKFWSLNANSLNTESKVTNPYSTSLQAFTNTLRREYANLKIESCDFSQLPDLQTIQKLLNAAPSRYSLFHEGGSFYVKELQRKNLPHLESNTIFKNDGTYLITGGLGGLGFSIAKHLLSKHPDMTLILGIRDTHRIEESGSKFQLRYNELLKLSSKIQIFDTSITSQEIMDSAINSLSQNHGIINGIIHTAGIAGDGFLINKEIAQFEKVLAPKIQLTTLLLNAIAKVCTPDWVVFYSSITSFLGEPGQSDYAAGNAFLDGLSKSAVLKGSKIISINWAPWQEIGMAYDYAVNLEEGEFLGLETSEGLLALEMAIKQDHPNIVIGKINTNKFLEKEDEYDFLISDQYKRGFTTSKPKNVVAKAEITPHNVLEKVVEIWKEVLGLHDVETDANFYSLGGNSILATQLMKEYEKTYPGVVNVADVFTYSTVNDISIFIESELGFTISNNLQENTEDKENMDDILQRLFNGDIQVDKANDLINI